MQEPGESDARTLAELRAEIDRIDEAMHRLLMERGAVIDALIRTKGTSRPGAAFRPQREAEMMRRLVARHAGRLPLATVEHLWREIIATFTHMQAPFGVVVDGSGDAAALRDLARFTFGFSVELRSAPTPEAVLAAVAASGRDLGVVAAGGTAARPWWRGLDGRAGPRIMALLPFIGAKGRPADVPAFVVSPALSDPSPPDLNVYSARGSRAAIGALARRADLAVLAEADGGGGTVDILVAVEPEVGGAGLAAAGLSAVAEAGGIARGVAVGLPSGVLRATVPAAASAAPPAVRA